MSTKPRNSDGSFRNTNYPKQLSYRSEIARWVEAETIHLKRLGMSFEVIADHVAKVARGQ